MIIDIDSVIEKTAVKLGLDKKEVKDIYYHYIKTVKEEMADKTDRTIDEIKLPYLGTLIFNRKKHERVSEKIEQNKKNKCES